jgi:hypothetical protein
LILASVCETKENRLSGLFRFAWFALFFDLIGNYLKQRMLPHFLHFNTNMQYFRHLVQFYENITVRFLEPKSIILEAPSKNISVFNFAVELKG